MGKSITDLSSVTIVGLDLAKHVFQVHGDDASGRVVVAKAIRRNKLLEFFALLPPCLVGLEACGSAHHWARELIKLGHDARMMPPAYVKPYIRRQKNDASDAAAICEAVTRPSMRFVGVRSLVNQAALMRHKTREMLVSQRTQLLNALRGHLTEVGVIAPQGLRYARELAELIEACDETIPFEVCEALAPLVVQLRNLDEAIARLDRIIAKLAQKDETARRLMSIPGFGPITASAMAATIQDTSSFAGPREFAAFLGLTPKRILRLFFRSRSLPTGGEPCQSVMDCLDQCRQFASWERVLETNAATTSAAISRVTRLGHMQSPHRTAFVAPIMPAYAIRREAGVT